MKYIIYALVDPNTHEVRYVGQTRQGLAVRYRNHEVCAKTDYPDPVYEWWRSLAPLSPIPVVLEYVEELARIPTVNGDTNHKREHRAHAAEIKWMKRFESFHLLQFVDRKRAAYRRLVNPWKTP